MARKITKRYASNVEQVANLLTVTSGVENTGVLDVYFPTLTLEFIAERRLSNGNS